MPACLQSIPVANIWNVRVHVFVLGYPEEGETILILFEENGKTLHSIITDSYYKEDCEHLAGLLEQFENPKIDWFIWTHPHEDHSVGIPELLDKFDTKHDCHIVIPNNLHAVDNKSLCKDAISGRDYLRQNYNMNGKHGPRRHRRYHTVDFDVFESNPREYCTEFVDSSTEDSLKVTLTIYGPDSVSALQNTDGTLKLNKNALSIVYTLDINGLIFLMGGDVNDAGAKIIPEEVFTQFHFLKIPHHGSDEPDTFIRRTKSNELEDSIGITTVFKKKELPKPEILKIYKSNLNRLFTTGGYEVDPNNGFGVVHLQYKPVELIMDGSPETFGNAYEIK